MLYRITAMFVVLAALVPALAGCGGNSVSPTAAALIGGVGSSSDPEIQDLNLLRMAAYVSPKGMELHRLDDSGFPCYPVPGELSVKENELSEGRIEWLILDNNGEPRPVFARVRITGSGYGTETVEAGDWGGEHKVIFAPFPTPIRDLDIGVCPIVTDMPSIGDCENRAIAKIVFEPGTEKTCSLGPLDGTGNIQPTADKHGHFPFFNPADWNPLLVHENYSEYEGYIAHWNFLDNQVEAVDETQEGYFERDKLTYAFADDQENVQVETQKKVLRKVHPTTVEGVETYRYLRLTFYRTLHGDYNQDGWVNVSDISPISAHYYDEQEGTGISNYNALEKAKPTYANHNPYIRPPGGILANPSDVVDGSMDGIIKVLETEGDLVRLKADLLVPPTEPQAQYLNDLSPIAIHFGESLGQYKIVLAPHDPDPQRLQYMDLEKIKPFVRRPDPDNLERYRYDVFFPLHYEILTDAQHVPKEQTSDGLDPDTYDVLIYSMDLAANDPLGPYGETTILRDYELDFNQVEVVDNDPQISWEQPPSFSADPDSSSFRAVLLSWSPAVITYPNTESEARYNIYIHICDGVDDPDDAEDVMSEFNAVVDEDGFEEINGVNYLRIKKDKVGQDESLWIPGAKVAFAIQGRISDKPGRKTSALFDVGYVSYDHSPPVWDPHRKQSVDTEDDILHWSYGSDSVGHAGFYVYYGYAVDLDTGVSGYRLYYTSQTPAEEGGTQFSDAQLENMLSDRANHVIEYPRDVTPGDPYMDYLTGKRCFFVEVDEVDRYEDLYVLCTAFNGEHYSPGSEPDFENESINRLAHNLADPPPNELFQRLILSDQQSGGDPARQLNPDYFSGDMACKGWYEGVRTAGEGLVIGHVNEAELQSVQYGNTYDVQPNLGMWKYTSGNPLDKESWYRYENYMTNFIRPDFIHGIEIPPDSEISAEWVVDTMEYPPLSQPEPVVTYQVRAANEGGMQERVYSMAASPETLALRYYMDDPLWEDNGAYAYPMDLTPWSFGFAFYEDNDDTFFYPHYMDLYGDWQTDQHGFARYFPPPPDPSPDPQVSWRMGTQTAWTGRILMESVIPTNYFDYLLPDWSGMPRFATVWGAPPTAGATPVLNLIWHNFGDLLQPYPLSAVIPGQNPASGMTPSFAATGFFNKGLESAYIVYTTDDAGEPVLRLAVTRGLGDLSDYRVSAFPDVESYALNKSYYDLIDCIFGASVLDQRGGSAYSVGFDPVEGSWTELENGVDPSAEAQKQPLCLSFIQTWHNSSLELPQGKELYYGEIYFDGEGQPYMWIELVDDEFSAALDNSGQQDPPDPMITAFRPIWCAIGMIDLDENELSSNGSTDTALDRLIPVISYGVRCDAGVGSYGQLKVACPLGFVAPPLELLDPDKPGGGIYLYFLQPDDSYPPGENPGPWPVISQ